MGVALVLHVFMARWVTRRAAARQTWTRRMQKLVAIIAWGIPIFGPIFVVQGFPGPSGPDAHPGIDLDGDGGADM